jgi:hypothetical protein
VTDLGHLGLQNPSGFGPMGNQGNQGPIGGPSTALGIFSVSTGTSAVGFTEEWMWSNKQSGVNAVRGRVPAPVAGHLDKFVINVGGAAAGTNLVAPGTIVFTVMVNGVATGLTVTYSAGQFGIKTSVGAVAIAANDLISIQAADGGTGGSGGCVWTGSVQYTT